MTVGVKKDISLPPVCEKEVARYAGGEFVPLKEEPRLTPMVCYIETDVFVDGGRVSLGKISVNSKNLAKNLSGQIILTGHSKGGNLSVFASTFCSDKIEMLIFRH